MLVVSRKIGERLIIEGGIVIQLLSVEADGHSAKIGIIAPKELRITLDPVGDEASYFNGRKHSSLAPLI